MSAGSLLLIFLFYPRMKLRLFALNGPLIRGLKFLPQISGLTVVAFLLVWIRIQWLTLFLFPLSNHLVYLLARRPLISMLSLSLKE